MLLGSSLILATEATSLEAFWVQEEGAAPWSFCLSLAFKILQTVFYLLFSLFLSSSIFCEFKWNLNFIVIDYLNEQFS